jgi:hypothetical protein
MRRRQTPARLFGDTMNVAARLCEHCKAVDRQLVVSRDLLRLITIPADFAIGEGQKHCGARSAGASCSACDRTRVNLFALSPRPTRSVSVRTIRSRPIPARVSFNWRPVGAVPEFGSATTHGPHRTECSGAGPLDAMLTASEESKGRWTKPKPAPSPEERDAVTKTNLSRALRRRP